MKIDNSSIEIIGAGSEKLTCIFEALKREPILMAVRHHEHAKLRAQAIQQILTFCFGQNVKENHQTIPTLPNEINKKIFKCLF